MNDKNKKTPGLSGIFAAVTDWAVGKYTAIRDDFCRTAEQGRLFEAEPRITLPIVAADYVGGIPAPMTSSAYVGHDIVNRDIMTRRLATATIEPFAPSKVAVNDHTQAAQRYVYIARELGHFLKNGGTIINLGPNPYDRGDYYPDSVYRGWASDMLVTPLSRKQVDECIERAKAALNAAPDAAPASPGMGGLRPAIA